MLCFPQQRPSNWSGKGVRDKMGICHPANTGVLPANSIQSDSVLLLQL